MSSISNILIYNNKGEIVHQTYSNPKYNDLGSELYSMFLEDGVVDNNNYTIIGVDLVNKKPILKKNTIKLTEEELKMQSLEKRNADLTYELMMNGGN